MKNNILLSIIFVLMLSVMVACGGQVAEDVQVSEAPEHGLQAESRSSSDTSQSSEKEQEPLHLIQPGKLPDERQAHAGDYSSASTAPQKRAPGGDRVSTNSYERPFGGNSMEVYYPDLDIVDTELYLDDNWVYVTIIMEGTGVGYQLNGNYAIEIDQDLDGQGDWLVLATAPFTQDWTTTGIRIWEDSNKDVGGKQPLSINYPDKGDGYEKLVFEQGTGNDPDMCWVRILAGSPNTIQIAFKQSLLDGDTSFMWGAWAGTSALNPAQFDLNDVYSKEMAGSSIVEFEYFYPIKELMEIDNTCRAAVGFQPSGVEPGICTVPGSSRQPGAPGCVQPPAPACNSPLWFQDQCTWKCFN